MWCLATKLSLLTNQHRPHLIHSYRNGNGNVRCNCLILQRNSNGNFRFLSIAFRNGLAIDCNGLPSGPKPLQTVAKPLLLHLFLVVVMQCILHAGMALQTSLVVERLGCRQIHGRGIHSNRTDAKKVKY